MSVGLFGFRPGSYRSVWYGGHSSHQPDEQLHLFSGQNAVHGLSERWDFNGQCRIMRSICLCPTEDKNIHTIGTSSKHEGAHTSGKLCLGKGGCSYHRKPVFWHVN